MKLSPALTFAAFIATLIAQGMSARPAHGMPSVLNLHDFNPGPAGAYPNSQLIKGTDGNFYGVTPYGGTSGSGGLGSGIAFKITPSGTYSVLHNFTGGKGDGSQPNALCQASDGNLYGTTLSNGTGGGGNIFRLSTTGTYTDLYDLQASVAFYASSLVQAGDGNLYGTTYYGGANFDGMVFRVTTTGTFTDVHDIVSTEGLYPSGLILAKDGNLYGTMQSGGANDDGTIFKVATSGVLTNLHSFTGGGAGGDGSAPMAGVIQGSDGSFYGTATAGGAHADGTLFKLTSSDVLTNLHAFAGGTGDGSDPQGTLVQTSNGIYGTTDTGGTSGLGTAFLLTTPQGAYSVVHSFGNSDGWTPEGGLATGFNGYLIGTAFGGAANAGIIYSMTTGGTVTVLHSFTYSDGGTPTTAVTAGTDGNWWGTSFYGGAAGYGVIFKSTLDGSVTIMHSFNKADGAWPNGQLVQASNGNFYGTTSGGGAHNQGTLYDITPSGTFTLLHTFDFANNNDGTSPQGPLIQATNGLIYGTTLGGGPGSGGTIFSFDPSTQIYRYVIGFDYGPNGGQPTGGIMQASNGNFYGTTEAGGADNDGTLFQISPTGTFSLVHSFTGGTSDGAAPTCTPIQVGNNLIGTATLGGKNNNGAGWEYPLGGSYLANLVNFTTAVGTGPGTVTYGPNSQYYIVPFFDGGLYDSGGYSYYLDYTNASAYELYEMYLSYTDGANPSPLDPLSSSAWTASGAQQSSWTFKDDDDVMALPHSSVPPLTDGTYYGTAKRGGAYGSGTLIRLISDANPHNVMVLQNASTRQIVIWHVYGNHLLSGPVVPVGPTSAYAIVGFADLNGDGHPDLLFQDKTTGGLVIWCLNGVQPIFTGSITSPGPSLSVVGIGDFNNDGKQDLLLQNKSTGALTIWLMNGAFRTSTLAVSNVPTGLTVAGCGDFNADGTSDILFQDPSTGKLTIWYMKGATRTGIGTPNVQPQPGWKVKAVANYSTAGYPDIVFQNAGSDQVVIWDYNNATFASSATVNSPLPPSTWQIVGPR